MKSGRFVVDTHVHAQRFAAGSVPSREAVAYENTKRLQYDMEAYGVDMCVLLPAFGMSDELNLEIVMRSPDRYVAACGITDYVERCRRGEEEWSIDGVCAELDRMLATGRFVATSESIPCMPLSEHGPRVVSRAETVENLLRIAEVCSKRHVVLRCQTGAREGSGAAGAGGSLTPATGSPLFAHDLAASFPDLAIVLDHGGIGAESWERWYEECLNVVGAHANVYVETGLWWRELYERPLADPSIGPEKLLWGTDWGASTQACSHVGRTPPSFPLHPGKQEGGRYQVDYWGWSLRELTSLRLSQDDLNLILGGNAASIFTLSVPCTRLFRPPV